MRVVSLVTEDELSEAIGLRLLKDFLHFPTSIQTLRRGGFGYIRSKMNSWCQLSHLQPVLIITDLDRAPCPALLKNQWIGTSTPGKNLVFRIAVKEIESWLLADHETIQLLVGKKAQLPNNPDDLIDPKQHLLELSKKAPRDIRYDLLKQEGSICSQGLGYNRRLAATVNRNWCPVRASERSPSLKKAILRIQCLNEKSPI